jgi:hypothetical protein
MKRILAFALIGLLVMVTAAMASPFLVCDPQAIVTSYQLTGPSWVPASVPAEADGSIHMDVSKAVVGVKNDLTVKACVTDVWMGVVCSTTAPFSFTRPAPGSITITIPANIRLSN